MGLYGIAMKPMYGAAAMALSSFFVCMNALRLNLVRIHDASHDRKIKQLSAADLEKSANGSEKTEKENLPMTKTLKVEGMMCEHCEARVRKALEKLDGVEAAVADHNKGTAVVTLRSDVADDLLKKAVEDQDYTVLGIK